MNIADIISKDAVLDNVQATSKRELIQVLSSKIANISGLDERVIFRNYICNIHVSIP